MYIFKETEKAKVLQGRTIKYLAEEKLHILNGKRGCSIRLANDITHCICWDAKILDYFYKKGE